uniref:UDP-N-acetylenolpyruvoylglucosamine reductase n=1 Tax=Anthurium amnicola TaxID=1678845 RepID=A0A1D1YGS2_9ARAE
MHMRILNWIQTKINGRQEKKTLEVATAGPDHAMQENHKEELGDWPYGLLAIGTFGDEGLKKESHGHEVLQSSHSLQDLPEFTLDEVNKLEKELTKLLSVKPKYKASKSETGKGCNSNLPLDKFLNFPSSLEVDRLACQKFCDELAEGEVGDLSPNTNVVLNKAKDLLADNRKTIKQKSISFLLKRMFACRNGFAPGPSLRDPISESRIDKLLKAILHKKIYPQNSAPMTVKKYLEQRRMGESEMRDRLLKMMRDKIGDKAEDGCKWVNTDSEYIVLEIKLPSICIAT